MEDFSKHYYFEKNRKCMYSKINSSDYLIQNYFLSISDKEEIESINDIKYPSEYCKICKCKQYIDSHFDECNYCPLCKKYGHYAFTNECKYCEMCKFYGHTFNECLIYKTYIIEMSKKDLFNLFGPLSDFYFPVELKGYPYFYEYFISIYNCVQYEREMLEILLYKYNNIIKSQSLVSYVKTIKNNSLPIYKVLNNNDLIRYILSFIN